MTGRISAGISISKIAAIGGCLLGLGVLFSFAPAKERRAVSMTKNTMILNAVIPPIDRSVPARVETATFALG